MIKKLARELFFLLLLPLLLTACQHALDEKDANTVQIANSISMHLLLPTDSFDATQKITAHYRDSQQQESQHTLLMQVQASPQAIVMAGLAPSGTRLFSLRFDGKAIDTWQSPLFSIGQLASTAFDARYVLADFELATLDHKLLQTALPHDTVLTDGTNQQGVRERTLRHNNGTVAIRIEYRGTQTHYCHLERHYCLMIDNLP